MADHVAAWLEAKQGGTRQVIVDVRRIRGWETGETRWPHRHYREALAAIFECDIRDLGFYPPCLARTGPRDGLPADGASGPTHDFQPVARTIAVRPLLRPTADRVPALTQTIDTGQADDAPAVFVSGVTSEGATITTSVSRRAILAAASAVLGGTAAATATAVQREPVQEYAQWLAWEMHRTRTRAVERSHVPPEMRASLSQMTAQVDSPFLLQDDTFTFAHDALADIYLAQKIARDVSNNDHQSLALAQTSRDTDDTIRKLLTRHSGSLRALHTWMGAEPNPVLRVNSAGILAKISDENLNNGVIEHLQRDRGTRALYSTAVTARVLGIAWPDARELAEGAEDAPNSLTFTDGQTHCLLAEVSASHDSAARWVSVMLLARAGLASQDNVRSSLNEALASEPCRENLRFIGQTIAASNRR